MLVPAGKYEHQHPGRIGAVIGKGMRRVDRNKNRGALPAFDHPITNAKRQLAVDDVEELLDFGVVMSTGVEAGRDQKLEDRATFRLRGSRKEIDLSAAQ